MHKIKHFSALSCDTDTKERRSYGKGFFNGQGETDDIIKKSVARKNSFFPWYI
jgi:hypothetical protein